MAVSAASENEPFTMKASPSETGLANRFIGPGRPVLPTPPPTPPPDPGPKPPHSPLPRKQRSATFAPRQSLSRRPPPDSRKERRDRALSEPAVAKQCKVPAHRSRLHTRRAS